MSQDGSGEKSSGETESGERSSDEMESDEMESDETESDESARSGVVPVRADEDPHNYADMFDPTDVPEDVIARAHRLLQHLATLPEDEHSFGE